MTNNTSTSATTNKTNPTKLSRAKSAGIPPAAMSSQITPSIDLMNPAINDMTLLMPSSRNISANVSDNESPPCFSRKENRLLNDGKYKHTCMYACMYACMYVYVCMCNSQYRLDKPNHQRHDTLNAFIP